MLIREQMNADLRQAMKARERAAISAIRSLMTAIDNAGAVDVEEDPLSLPGMRPDVPRRELTEEEVQALIRKEADERRRAIAEYTRLEKEDVVGRLHAELIVITRYLEGPRYGAPVEE